MATEAEQASSIGPAEDWFCLCPLQLNPASVRQCDVCKMIAPWLERKMEMTVRQVKTPHGNGWYTFVRGAMVSRREALWILLHGPKRARIVTCQTNNEKLWSL